VVHAGQAGFCARTHAPALQVSVVQTLPSSAQSADVVQAVQPGTTVDEHVPATQASVVHAFASSHSASVVHGAQPPATRFTERRAEPVTSGALVANASATFVKLPSPQLGAALPLSVTVTVFPTGRFGTRTSSGFVVTTVHVTLASSLETATVR